MSNFFSLIFFADAEPCAMALAGVGWGFLVGGAVKEIMIFIFDERSMAAMCGDAGARIGGQLNFTIGPWGRNYEAGVGISNKGAAGTFSVAFSKGAFVAMSVEGALVGPRGNANDAFYGQAGTSPVNIISGNVPIPADKPSMIQGVYEKLNKLAEGVTYVPTDADLSKKTEAAKLAQSASDAVAAQNPDAVQKVDAAAEAAKESS